MSKPVSQPYLSSELLKTVEAEFLYEALNSFGYETLLQIGKRMFQETNLPLENNWDNFEEFYIYLNFFSDLVSENKKKTISSLLTEEKKDKEGSKYFSIPQISSFEKLRTEARAILVFLESVAEFRDYEVVLNALGYNRTEADLYTKDNQKKKRKKGDE